MQVAIAAVTQAAIAEAQSQAGASTVALPDFTEEAVVAVSTAEVEEAATANQVSFAEQQRQASSTKADDACFISARRVCLNANQPPAHPVSYLRL
jgi:hypothetical protein